MSQSPKRSVSASSARQSRSTGRSSSFRDTLRDCGTCSTCLVASRVECDTPVSCSSRCTSFRIVGQQYEPVAGAAHFHTGQCAICHYAVRDPPRLSLPALVNVAVGDNDVACAVMGSAARTCVRRRSTSRSISSVRPAVPQLHKFAFDRFCLLVMGHKRCGLTWSSSCREVVASGLEVFGFDPVERCANGSVMGMHHRPSAPVQRFR